MRWIGVCSDNLFFPGAVGLKVKGNCRSLTTLQEWSNTGSRAVNNITSFPRSTWYQFTQMISSLPGNTAVEFFSPSGMQYSSTIIPFFLTCRITATELYYLYLQRVTWSSADLFTTLFLTFTFSYVYVYTHLMSVWSERINLVSHVSANNHLNVQWTLYK